MPSGPPRRPLWPPVTNPTTIPTPLGPIVMAPGRRGSRSASGLRVSPVSGRIRVTFMSRIRGSSGRSSFATRRAGILKPTAVGCRSGMSGLRNKAIYDEIRKFGYPLVRLQPPPPPSWYGGKMEVHSHGTARYDESRPAECVQWFSSTIQTLERDHIGPTWNAVWGCAGRAVLAEPPARRVKFTRKSSR